MKNGLHLTPETLAAAYTFLRTTRPFSRWKLPPAHEVRFRVTRSSQDAGYCRAGEIGISARCSAHTESMLATMAHEMIHLYLDRKKVRSHHGAEFLAAAERVGREHGFDHKRFF
jgi:predicted SprT family Zn-dependent metalloprotease